MTFKNAMDDIKKKIDDLIGSNGYAFIGVKANEDNIGFTYTIGRSAVNKAELIMLGRVDPSRAQPILTSFLMGLKDDEDIALGVVESRVFGLPGGNGSGLRFEIVQVDTNIALDNYMQMVDDKYTRATVKVYQVIWPDDANQLPGEEGYQDIYGQVLLPRI